MSVNREGLAPCPFCGSLPEIRDGKYRIDHWSSCYLKYIKGVALKNYLATEEAVGKWNRRALLAESREGGKPLVRKEHERDCSQLMGGDAICDCGADETPPTSAGTEPVAEETADFAWNEVLDAFRRVWPGDDLIYSESPVELIYRLRDERDAALDAGTEGLREHFQALLDNAKDVLSEIEGHGWYCENQLRGAVKMADAVLRASPSAPSEGVRE